MFDVITPFVPGASRATDCHGHHVTGWLKVGSVLQVNDHDSVVGRDKIQSRRLVSGSVVRRLPFRPASHWSVKPTASPPGQTRRMAPARRGRMNEKLSDYVSMRWPGHCSPLPDASVAVNSRQGVRRVRCCRIKVVILPGHHGKRTRSADEPTETRPDDHTAQTSRFVTAFSRATESSDDESTVASDELWWCRLGSPPRRLVRCMTSPRSQTRRSGTASGSRRGLSLRRLFIVSAGGHPAADRARATGSSGCRSRRLAQRRVCPPPGTAAIFAVVKYRRSVNSNITIDTTQARVVDEARRR